jgi:hypothetical protein
VFPAPAFVVDIGAPDSSPGSNRLQLVRLGYRGAF